jgi:hypothetical protein
VKTKLRGRVLVVQDGNDELTMRDNVFQLDELVDPYRVALPNDLEEYSNFHIIENIFIDVDIGELNDILRANEHTQVNEDDDNDKINVEDCDGDENIEEKDNSD